MTKSTQQLADEMARKCAEHCVGLNLYPEKTASVEFAKGIKESIPLQELLEVARAAKDYGKGFFEHDIKCNCDYCQLARALTNLQNKVEL